VSQVQFYNSSFCNLVENDIDSGAQPSHIWKLGRRDELESEMLLGFKSQDLASLGPLEPFRCLQTQEEFVATPDHWFGVGFGYEEAGYSFDGGPSLPSIFQRGGCDRFFSYDLRRVDQALTPFKNLIAIVDIISLRGDLKFVYRNADHLASLTNL